MNSIESKKEVRLKTAESYLDAFKKKYTETQHTKELSKIEKDLKENLQQYDTKG